MPGACSSPSSRDESHSESLATGKLSAENRMRRKLRFFFMNPVEKWQAKRRFPYKFLVQVFKIFFVTIQVRVYKNEYIAYKLMLGIYVCAR